VSLHKKMVIATHRRSNPIRDWAAPIMIVVPASVMVIFFGLGVTFSQGTILLGIDLLMLGALGVVVELYDRRRAVDATGSLE
jgi:hypothetical protein